MQTRIAVFDAHPVVHQGLVELLPQHGFIVVSQSVDGRNAVADVQQSRADIVITDVRMPFVDGLKVLEQLSDAGLPCKSIVYTVHNNPTYVARAIALGAVDFVFKFEPEDKLVQALTNAVAGTPPAADTVFARFRDHMRQRKFERSEQHELTDRECQVLRHLGLGLSNREIGRSLGISVETVKEHVQNILRKQDSNDRTQAAVWAVRDGLVYGDLSRAIPPAVRNNGATSTV
ncbi:MAG: response regulator [Pirellulaceae bacterium]